MDGQRGLCHVVWLNVVREWTFANACLCFSLVTAVYDSTLNFKNNETPTLRGILSGKKYYADLYVR